MLTEYQDVGGSERASGRFPSKGFEIQVNNSHTDRDPNAAVSYHVADVLDDSPAKDDEWFTEDIVVEGDTITRGRERQAAWCSGRSRADWNGGREGLGPQDRAARAPSRSRATIPRAPSTTRTSGSSRCD